DNLLRPTRILTEDPGQNPLLDYQYNYDVTGNIQQKATQTKTVDYDYDLLQRLTEAAATTQPGTGEPQVEIEGWQYDPNGNRTQDNLNPGSWVYGLNDRLQASPVASYGYDQAGNTISKTEGGIVTHYRYNAEGRLARIEDASQILIAEYLYDPLGRRIRKQTQSEIIYFHYADEGLVGEIDEAGNPIRLYGFQPDSIWTTDPIYQKTAQGYAYYQNDHLGMPQQLIQKNGAKVWGGEFRAFGELVTESGTWGNRLRFPGQYFDQETGNYYNYFRDYDPTSGRYVQEDPVGLYAGLNTYNYVSANPIVNGDPEGLICGTGACAAAAVAITRCIVTCTAVAAAMDAATGSCDFKNSAKHCVTDCLLPWNWFKFGKTGVGAGGAKRGTTVIGRTKDLDNLKKGERPLMDRLKDNTGSHKDKWRRNDSVLRDEMSKGKPIRDASPGDKSGQWLNAERNTLKNRGWTFDSKTNYWMPPK
ncbi:MAG: RHS domain-containing protein, partial [Candidatus Thiodiazotropha sp. (ex Lucinoma annulata)]|nr:RHS domain-containing protein [Candidatus Thiodiazotropha sp. (ex Lucinoma annulata)]